MDLFYFIYFKRRKNQKKFEALEKRFSEPRVVPSREFQVLKSLQKQMTDLQQSEIIINYFTNKYGEPEKKGVKFSSPMKCSFI